MRGKYKRICLALLAAAAAILPLPAHEYFPSLTLSYGPMFESKWWTGADISASIFFEKDSGAKELDTTTPELERLKAEKEARVSLAEKAKTITFDMLSDGTYKDVFTADDMAMRSTETFIAWVEPLAERAQEIVESSTPEAIEAKRAEYLAAVDTEKAKAEAIWAEADAEIHRLQGDQESDARKDIILAEKDAVKAKADEREAIINPEGYRETRYYTFVDGENQLVDSDVYPDISARLAVADADEAGKLNALQAQYQAVDNEYEVRINEVYQEAKEGIEECKAEIQRLMNLYEETFKHLDNSAAVKEVENYLVDAIRIVLNNGRTDDIDKVIREIEADISRRNYLASQADIGRIGLSVGASMYFGDYTTIPFGTINAGASFKLYDGEMYRLILDTDAVIFWGTQGMFGLGVEAEIKNMFVFSTNFGINLSFAADAGYVWNYPYYINDYYGHDKANTSFLSCDFNVGFVFRFH